jgi:CopG family nickel-responsive transcriptional regulator
MIAELIRHELAEHSEARTNSVLAGTVTLIYRAESGRVRHALAQIQSTFIKEVISSQHVLLEDDQSLEVLLVQGPARRLNALCDDLRKVRGVQQIKLVTTTSLLPPLHSHGAHDPNVTSRSSRGSR